ncbi:hypothetical protein [Phaffia rhodozyma]|uniref:Uncharacterized protein n=1 Tax=Phaffia rhodozyma TaxID=264483 RepID=A0A0F7STK0_PHARH|nr:hypothetical protein [Phaffia rhodozyma]
MSAVSSVSTFTEHPEIAPVVIFPRPGLQLLAAFVFMGGLSVLSFILARRSLNLGALSTTAWRRWSIPRLACLATFFTSWAFLFSSGILVFGVGTSSRAAICSLGIFSCILFYAFSKVFIYLFLIEKVHIVSNTKLARTQSWMYRVCLACWAPYLIIVIMMIIGRISTIDPETMVCHIGLETYASLSLLIYDLFLNVFLTSLFVWPLLKSKFVNPKIRAVAMRTCGSCGLDDVYDKHTSSHSDAWAAVRMVLSSCGGDVTINALVLFYVTMSPGQGRRERDTAAAAESYLDTGVRASIKLPTMPGRAGHPGTRGAASQNEYFDFPEPTDVHKQGQTAIPAEEGGGYVVNRDEGSTRCPLGSVAIMAKDDAFVQRKVDANYMQEREKNRAKGRANQESKKSSLWSTLKQATGIENTERHGVELGSNSIQIRVNTEVAMSELQPANEYDLDNRRGRGINRTPFSDPISSSSPLPSRPESPHSPSNGSFDCEKDSIDDLGDLTSTTGLRDDNRPDHRNEESLAEFLNDTRVKFT